MRSTSRTPARRTAALVGALALVPALAACASGVDAGTTVQGPSGNGANANLGPIQLRDMTLVSGSVDPQAATTIGTIVNTGTDPDALLGATITSPTGATVRLAGTGISGSTLPLPPQSAVRIGFNSDDHLDVSGLSITPSFFAQVQFSFQKAGTITMPVMVVPPTGIYQGISPL